MRLKTGGLCVSLQPLSFTLSCGTQQVFVPKWATSIADMALNTAVLLLTNCSIPGLLLLTQCPVPCCRAFECTEVRTISCLLLEFQAKRSSGKQLTVTSSREIKYLRIRSYGVQVAGELFSLTRPELPAWLHVPIFYICLVPCDTIVGQPARLDQ
eukprot:scpid107681/ scgid30751/ 